MFRSNELGMIVLNANVVDGRIEHHCIKHSCIEHHHALLFERQ